MKQLLVIGKNWPEPQSTGAGLRMLQLLTFFKLKDYEITFACAASKTNFSENLENRDITEVDIELNNSSFDNFIVTLNPDIVLYDRFMTEEQYGWRIAENCPKALTLLDTEDLHFLRKARQKAYKSKLDDARLNVFTDEAKREIASILRCDLSLIISQPEVEVLKNTFNISSKQLFYLPFLFEKLPQNHVASLPTFEERKHFVMIGNYLHAPNLDAVKYVITKVWSLIRSIDNNAQLYIYGAYGTSKVSSYHKPKQGIYIMGRAESSIDILQHARVLLSPIPYGAGLKTKFLEAMITGTPSITNTIGAEGICGDLSFSGHVSNDAQSQAEQAISLYSNKTEWLEAQKNGFSIIERRFNKNGFEETLMETISSIASALQEHRQEHFIGQILQHHTLQSNKYMSKWIEEKNSGRL